MRNTSSPPKRIPPRWLLVGAGLLVVALLAFGLVTERPPLVPTDNYIVQYSVRGQPYTDAEIFHPVFMGHLLYVRLPVLADTRYLWFLVDTRRSVVSSPHGPRHCRYGFDYIHRDQAFGIPLTFPKIEDAWTVSFDPDTVTFSNETIQVTVSRRSAPNTAVEPTATAVMVCAPLRFGTAHASLRRGSPFGR